jgi:hypothetical protein
MNDNLVQILISDTRHGLEEELNQFLKNSPNWALAGPVTVGTGFPSQVENPGPRMDFTAWVATVVNMNPPEASSVAESMRRRDAERDARRPPGMRNSDLRRRAGQRRILL